MHLCYEHRSAVLISGPQLGAKCFGTNGTRFWCLENPADADSFMVMRMIITAQHNNGQDQFVFSFLTLERWRNQNWLVLDFFLYFQFFFISGFFLHPSEAVQREENWLFPYFFFLLSPFFSNLCFAQLQVNLWSAG